MLQKISWQLNELELEEKFRSGIVGIECIYHAEYLSRMMIFETRIVFMGITEYWPTIKEYLKVSFIVIDLVVQALFGPTIIFKDIYKFISIGNFDSHLPLRLQHQTFSK